MDDNLKKSEYKEHDSFFMQVVREAVRQLTNNKSGYCFNFEQVKEICSRVDNVDYRLVDGIYYLERKDENGE